MKKLITFVLAVVLLLSIVPITRIISFSADIVEEGPCGENVYYSLDSDGLLTLTGSGEMYGYIILNTSSIKYLKIGSGITFYRGFKGDRDLEGISVDSKNAVYSSSGNCLIRTDTKVLCLGCKNSVIPDDGSVVTVAGFGYCAGLESINIPVSVHSIGDYAFQYCTGLKSIALPQVSSIGEGAFLGCTRLKNITFSNNIISVGECAFANCTGLTSVTIPKPMYGSIRIDYDAFRNCNNLKDVYFKGTEEDWKQVRFEDDEPFKNAQIHYQKECVTHDYKATVTKATPSKDGKIVKVCSVCGDKVTTKIRKASNVGLSKTSFTYNGRVQKPTLTVKDSAGKAISSKYYTTTWSNANSKAAGTYTVKVTFKGNYSGTKTLTYKILPRQVTGLKVSKVEKDSITVAWTKLAEAKAYMVEYSADGKTWKSATLTTNTYTLKSLKAGSKWQFKVTALDGTKKVAGKVSAVLKTGTLTAAPKISKLTSTKAKTATVTWGKVTGAKSYIVYKSTDGKKFTKVKDGITKATYSITGLTGGKKIYVKVIAVNAFGKKSAASAVKSVTVKK